jgi:hypothetical protein
MGGSARAPIARVQLENLARDRDEPGKTAFRVEQTKGGRKRTIGSRTVSVTDTVEIRRERYDGDKRTWALTFHVFWRPSSDKNGRVGVFAELDVREADGRPVSKCRSTIGREPYTRGRFTYVLTSIDPAAYEQAPDDWLASDAELRKFVSDFFAAFLNFTAEGTPIFVQAELRDKDRVRRGR